MRLSSVPAASQVLSYFSRLSNGVTSAQLVVNNEAELPDPQVRIRTLWLYDGAPGTVRHTSAGFRLDIAGEEQ